jgi:hypothetical protein
MLIARHGLEELAELKYVCIGIAEAARARRREP